MIVRKGCGKKALELGPVDAPFVRQWPGVGYKIARDEVPVIEALMAFVSPYMSNGEDGSQFVVECPS